MREIILILLEGVILPLLVVCLIHTLINMRLLRRLEPIDSTGREQSKFLPVSVLVPARNEERQIKECLISLINQQPPVREIILLDDRSTDATAEIARELGFREGFGERLRLLSGEELPPDWVGKNWACHQLVQAADPASSHLLFTDADTIHSPASLKTALSYAVDQRIDLLSLWPHQITVTWAEKLIIPLLYLLAVAFHPFSILFLVQAKPERARQWGLTPKKLSNLGVANGQFLLFRRIAYERIGGHQALKNHLVEDVAFGRRVASQAGEGLRLCNADGGELLQCRMYANFTEVWEGFSKNIRPVFESSLASFLIFGSLLGGMFLMPSLLLAINSCDQKITIPTLIAVSLIFLIRILLTLRFRTSWLSVLAHPLAMALALVIGLNSWRLCLGEGVSWKGRTYSRTTQNSME